MISLFGNSDPTIQRVLLELSFAEEQAADNLAVLERAIEADTLTEGQNRILPWIAQRLPPGCLSPFAESRIRSTFRYTLYRNNLLLHRAQQLRQALLQAGLGECIFLKGVVMALVNPHGVGARPMADVDLLLSGMQHRPEEALAFFAGQGMAKGNVTLRSVSWLSPERLEFDVHWYLHNWALRQSSVDRMQADARVVEHARGQFTIPCAEHNLAHILAHGLLSPSVQYDGRWAIDALAILSQRPELDQTRFLSFVNEFATPDAVRIALQVLVQQTPASIDFDRSAVTELAAGVRRGRPGSFWLYHFAPGPWDALGQEALRPLRHHVKTQVRTRLIEPALVARHNGTPFWRSVGASIDFPPAGPAKFCRLIWRKVRRLLRERRVVRTEAATRQ